MPDLFYQTKHQHFFQRSIAALLLLLLGLLPTLAEAHTDTPIQIRIKLISAAEPDYKPLSFKNDQGAADGFSVELLQTVTKATGRKVSFDVRPWAQIKQELADEHLDVLPLVGRTPEREALFDFTVPYLTLYGTIVTRVNDDTIRSLEDLRDRKVGVMSGDNAEEFMRRERITDSLVSTKTYAEAMQMLAQGQLDAVVIQELVASGLMEELKLREIEIRSRIRRFRQDFCFAVTEGDKDLLALLNEGLSKVIADGTLERLKHKWLGNIKDTGFSEEAIQLTDAELKWIVAHPEVPFTGDPNWLPYEAFQDNGTYIGIVADHLKLIERKTGLSFKPIPVTNWTESLRIATEGQVAVISGDAADAILNKRFNPVAAHSQNPIVIIMDSRQHYVEKLHEIKGKKIALIKGYGYTADIFKHYPGFNFIEVENIQQGLEGVSDGHFDAMLATMALASYHMVEMGLYNIRVVGKTPIIMDLTLFVDNKLPILHSIINKALKSISRAETQEIMQSWRHERYVEKTDYRLILQVTGILLLTIAMTLIWNRRLRLQIKKRLEAEQALNKSHALLQKSEARFRRIFENTDAIAVRGYDRNRQVIYWNPASERLYGYQADDAMGKQLEDLIIPEEMREAVIAGISAWVAGGPAVPSNELTLLRADGSPVQVYSSHVMLKGADNQPEMYCIDIDLTDRRQAEEAIREQEQQIRDLLNSTAEAIYGLDLHGNCTFANAACARILGYPGTDDLLGPGIHELIHHTRPDGSHYPEEECLIIRAFQAGEDIHMDSELFWRADGSSFHAEYWSYPVRREGKVAGAVVTFLDITERKLADKAIRDSEERYHTIFEGAPEGVWLIGPNRQTIEVNRRLCDILGYHRDEMVGKSPLDFVDDKNREIFIQQTDKIKTTDLREYEIELRHKDGHNIPTFFRANTIRDATGGVLEAVAFVTDLTEQKRAEKALRRAQKMDAIGQLTGGIAHDFNNILGIILGNLDLLNNQLPDDPALHRRVETIKKSAQRATNLTKQLLVFSRLQTTETTITNLNQLVNEMDDLIARSLTPQIEVEHQFADDLWLCDVDPGDFQDTMINLIINARDAMPGGGKLTLKTTNKILDSIYCTHNPGATPGEYVQMVVSDSGIGIPAEQQEHVFEPFFTTKERGKGTGLGLAMVYGFVKRSGGFINLYSEQGIGTTFRIYLPRVYGKEQPTIKVNEHLASPPQGSETILAVDDEKDLLDLARESLENLGYRVLTASSGRQALEVLAKEPDIDLLFSDVVMPGGVNGYELAKRATTEYPTLKVILTSGYTEKTAARDGQAHFQSKLLSKPYSQKELAQLVRKSLSKPKEKNPSTTSTILPTPVEWSDTFSIGIEAIDHDHQQLLALLKQCIQALEANDEVAARRIIDALQAYTVTHFRREETVMAACGYPGLDNHRQVHQLLTSKLNKLREHTQHDKPDISDLAAFLNVWLFDHIQVMDQAIAPYCRGKQEIIAQALQQLDEPGDQS